MLSQGLELLELDSCAASVEPTSRSEAAAGMRGYLARPASLAIDAALLWESLSPWC